MSAVFGATISTPGVQLCQATPEIKAWIERHVPLREARPAHWHQAPPNIFHGLTYFPHDEANVPPRLNVLRWPSGASRWATYDFLATDDQLAEIRAKVYGADEDDHRNSPRHLEIHGGGDTITVDQMWLLPPRPLSETPSWRTDRNRLWLCSLVDQRYWWNQDHCGDLSESGTWDELLEHLRDRAGFLGGTPAASAWDCPAVGGEWLAPHVDLLAAHSLPLGMMIDAVAWNVGRRVSVDYERTSAGYPPIVHVQPYTWHDTRAQANNTNTAWFRMAGGDYNLGGRDLSAAVPDKVRLTFADGVDRDYQEISVNDVALVDYTGEHGKGEVVFHDRLDLAEASSAERTALLKAVAKAYLGFTAKAAYDVTYTGHAKWLPEALSDAIEWHELHQDGTCLVPDPQDGKVRQRRELLDMARTRIVRPPFNLLADDLWHGNGGAGSGSVPGADYTGTCPDGTTFTVTINGGEITVTMPDDE